MKKYIHNNISIDIHDNGQFTINTKENIISSYNPSARANFEIAVATMKQLDLTDGEFEFRGVREKKNGISLKYIAKKYALEVETELLFTDGADIILQTNYARNIGEKDIRLTKFSSTVMENIAGDSLWCENDEIAVHICHNKWHGEGQWREYSLSDLGIYPTAMHHWARTSHRIHSVGSWSTSNYYPLVMIEDRKHRKIWYLETEGSHSWQIKLTGYGGFKGGVLSAQASGCDENDGWFYDLKPDETYQTERAIYGVTNGGFEEAIRELNTFKRRDSRVDKNQPLVVFNDYMDCIWTDQSPKALMPLIDKAAEVGCEVFCIDDGWGVNDDVYKFGDWKINDKLYSQTSLKEIADIIKEKGMIPGIWFELDSCDINSIGARLDDNALLKRFGEPVGNRGRCFYNMTNEKVREYLKDKVRTLYNMGFRYIKNDYNLSTGIGCTNTYAGESLAEGLIENANAFYEFINGLYEEFPDIIIENCSSGALRCDNKILRNFALQSTSDQELYENNPSIVMGSVAVMPPEKAGIWSYPYPVTLYERENFIPTDEYLNKRVDGKETVFNTVTAMLGAFVQSGRIDFADKKNTGLIKKGIALYKKIREYIVKSHPVYPMGLCKIGEKCVIALGLECSEKLLLSVWNISDKDEEISIDLSKYIDNFAVAESVFSAEDTKAKLQDTRLDLTLSDNSAVFIEITK